jgi:hypothetical protein
METSNVKILKKPEAENAWLDNIYVAAGMENVPPKIYLKKG